MRTITCIEARCIEARSLERFSIFSKDWEMCEGTENALQGDLNLLRTQWNGDERRDYGRVVTEYRMSTLEIADEPS